MYMYADAQPAGGAAPRETPQMAVRETTEAHRSGAWKGRQHVLPHIEAGNGAIGGFMHK